MGKDYQLQWNFGITLDDYNEMLKRQNGLCAICSKASGTDKHSGVRTKALSVDHDHETGGIRGLLCGDCNRGIGQLGDSLERLKSAVRYLESFEKRKTSVAVDADALLTEMSKL